MLVPKEHLLVQMIEFVSQPQARISPSHLELLFPKGVHLEKAIVDGVVGK